MFGMKPWGEGVPVERKDTGEHGTIAGNDFGDYTPVKWSDGTSTWIRSALLRHVNVSQT